MKQKKGFTLIELLAVIIILAIIALIATPIVMKVIESGKEGAAERSAENYIRAVETQLMSLRINENPINDGTYTIRENGNLCYGINRDCEASEMIEIEISGKKPNGGYIAISNGKVEPTGTNIMIDDHILIIGENGSIIETEGFSPQYYSYTMNIVIGETEVPENPSNMPPADRNEYLGYDVQNGIITAGYLCFKENGNQYCLKAEDESAYLLNTNIMRKAYYDNLSNCNFYDVMSQCDTVWIEKAGSVQVQSCNNLVSGLMCY